MARRRGRRPVSYTHLDVYKRQLLTCALGLNTRPVGSTEFVGWAIGGVSVGQVMRSIAPFYGALLVTLLAVTYIPALSLALPRWIGS